MEFKLLEKEAKIMNLILGESRGSGIIKLIKRIDAKSVWEIGCLEGMVTSDILANTNVKTLVSTDIKITQKMYELAHQYPTRLWLQEIDSLKREECMGSILHLAPFDVVIVDAGHQYQNAVNDIEMGFNILRLGGILIVDDYDYIAHTINGVIEECGVIQATREFVQKYGKVAYFNIDEATDLEYMERLSRQRKEWRSSGKDVQGCYWYTVKN